MLKKRNRLTKKEFAKVFHKGTPFIFTDFIVKYNPSAVPFSRFGVSVGLKISKSAVERNAMRRHLYLAVQDLMNSLAKGDYIILVRQKKDIPALKTSFFHAFNVISTRFNK